MFCENFKQEKVYVENGWGGIYAQANFVFGLEKILVTKSTNTREFFLKIAFVVRFMFQSFILLFLV